MDFLEATQDYEQWLSRRIQVLPKALELKHRQMRVSVFRFLRATFYRWLQLWPAVCPALAGAPEVLAVGDLHLENFGTWRDSEGRLIWGVSDFDEACPLPYTLDLVRLATSALLATEEGHLTVSPQKACQAILEGYREGLEGARPWVLEERHRSLRSVALSGARDPVRFWAKLENLPKSRMTIPRAPVRLLGDTMPSGSLAMTVRPRTAGLGSLGRLRVVAIAEWQGGLVAREAKAVAPSAYYWTNAPTGKPRIWSAEIQSRAVRVEDPCSRLFPGWTVRRLSPHCSKMEIDELPKKRNEVKLLAAMGFETANIHSGSRKALGAVRRDLSKRSAKWLHRAARDMAGALSRDFDHFCSKA